MIYNLPKLPYNYTALEPYISERQLKIHHTKHHQAYVDNSNKLVVNLKSTNDIKSTLKTLSFNLGGHVLHSLFWKNLTNKKTVPSAVLKKAISKDFGSLEKFRKMFSETAVSVEGSGWAALVKDNLSKKLLVMQIEKHNVNLYPNSDILLVLDVWEHAYYLDYKNARAKFVESFWNIIDWNEVSKRFRKN